MFSQCLGTYRCSSSLSSIPFRSYSNDHCSNVDKSCLTSTNNNNNSHTNINVKNKNNVHLSLPTIINITNDALHTENVDNFSNDQDLPDVIPDILNVCDVDERSENELPFPGFVEKAFYCFRQTTTPRYQCLKLITWPWFERISMLVILLNCITLGMYQPCAHRSDVQSAQKCDTILCISLQTIDYFVFAFFTIEMCIKMTAMGIFGKGTYLAESWNRLDCFIVVTGLLEFLMPGDHVSLSAIRTIRVLRPLRAINRVPSMRIIVMLLLQTLPMLVNVILLCFLIFFIFGIVGVQLWKGLLRNRCFLQLNTTIIENYAKFDDFPFQSFYVPPEQDSFICSGPLSSGMTKCSEIPQYRQDNMTCELDFYSWSSSLVNQTAKGCINWHQYYQLCATSDENPYFGSISFDNIGSAWLAIFQIITLESWSGIMYYVQDAHSFWVWIYFVCLIVIGSFFMMNLCLVVISAQFSITKQRETEKMLEEQRRFSISATATKTVKQGSCWEEIITYLEQLSKQACKRLRASWKNYRQKRLKDNRKHGQKIRTQLEVLTPEVSSTPNANIGSLVPLINQNHRPNCRYYRSQSLLPSTALQKSSKNDCDTHETSSKVITQTLADNNSFIGKHYREKQNLETDEQEEQIERHDLCDCNFHDESFNPSKCNEEGDVDDETSEVRQKRVNSSCCSPFTKIRKSIARFVHSKIFDRIIFSAIIINTLSMSIEYHGQPQLLTDILEYSNYVFIVLFTIEMLFKLIAEGCITYIKNPFNIFDGTIVIISFIELCGTQNSGLSVLRTFRLLRVLKLIRFLPTLRRQMVIMVKTLDNVAAFLLLLILFIFIFTVLGMHLFGGEFCTLEAFNTTSRKKVDMKCRCCTCIDFDLFKNSTDIKDVTCIEERANFNSLHSALLTVFQILTQEDWNEVMYNGISKTGSWSAVYFISLMIFGNYVLFNLLVAILVEGFSNDEEDSKTNSNKSIAQLNRENAFEIQENISSNTHIPKNLDESTIIDDASRRQCKIDKNTDSHSNSTMELAVTTTQLSVKDQNEMQLNMLNGNNINMESSTLKSAETRSFLKNRENYSLYLFSPSNRIRTTFQWFIGKNSFDYLILFFITLSSIALAMERPSISPTSLERQLLSYANFIFTIAFTMEMIIKVVAKGFIVGSDTYLHTGWNVMDGFLVIISIIDVTTMHHSANAHADTDNTSHILSMLRVFRLLRTLRPLTVINRARGLKIVVTTLLSSLKPIGHIAIIGCIFFTIFGILGVQLFKGKFYYCEGPLTHTVTKRKECEALHDHKWQNQRYNFDNLGQALLTLFVLSSKDGWVQIMYTGIDAVDVDIQPIRNHSEIKLIYFIAFILIVSFFVLNMFVGVVVENFHSCQAQQELQETEEKSKKEKSIERKQRIMRALSYYSQLSSWRQRLHGICINKYFDLVISFIIGLNVVTMSLEFYMMPTTLEKFLEYCNYVFTVVFLFEFIFKIMALGPVRYFKDSWNRLDSIIVISSIVGIIMEKMLSGHILPINPTIIRVIRVFRIARVLKLLKMAKGTQALLDTVIEALPQVGNLSVLFLLLFFIFATLGVELFGKLECTDENPCSTIDKHANFQNFGIAFLTLFRIATGDNWNGIMKDTLRENNSSQTSTFHIMPIVAPIYFVVFVLMTQFILVNILIAVLMKKLEDSNKMIADGVEIDDDIEEQVEHYLHDRNYAENLLLDEHVLQLKDEGTVSE